MPTFTSPPVDTALGAFNPNVSGFVSLDLALLNKDIYLSPSGDLETVTGNQKLKQDIMLFLLSPVGSSIANPNWGNKSLSLLGEAISYQGQVEQLISSSIQDLQQFKANEQVLRKQLLEASELISSVQNISISSTSPTDNSIQVVIDIETVLGDVINVQIPLGLSNG